MDPLSAIPEDRIPRHIAVIMDGNGRWAVRRGLERIRGHQQGAKAFKSIVTECAKLRCERGGPDYLTLYSFSLENWKRPLDEVGFLMQMYIEYLRQERATMMENNIRFAQIGRLENLPEPVLDEVNITLEQTKANTGLTLVLASIHRRHARPGSFDSHRRRDAREQLSPLANQLCRVVRQRRSLARFWRGRSSQRDLFVRITQSAIRSARSH
jgi:hypothetical protein